MLAQGQTQGSTLQERTNKTLTTGPFGNTCEADEVSPEVEAGVVAETQVSATLAGTQICDYITYRALSIDHSSIFNPYYTSQIAQSIATFT
jgi:hypothetical protein